MSLHPPLLYPHARPPALGDRHFLWALRPSAPISMHYLTATPLQSAVYPCGNMHTCFIWHIFPKIKYSSVFTLAERPLPLPEQVDSGALAPTLLRRFSGEAGLGGSMGGGSCQQYLRNIGRRPMFPPKNAATAVILAERHLPFSKAGRQWHTRADATTAFYAGARGMGWFECDPANNIWSLWAEGPCSPSKKLLAWRLFLQSAVCGNRLSVAHLHQHYYGILWEGQELVGHFEGGVSQQSSGNMDRGTCFHRKKCFHTGYPCRAPFILAGTGRQWHIRADTNTAFSGRAGLSVLM